MSYNYVQEMNTGKGTEGSLLIPRKIYDTLWPDYIKMVLPRELCAINVSPDGVPGSSLDIDLEAVNAMKVRGVGEGAEVWLEDPLYLAINVKPVKYGARINITRELMEDAKFPLLQRAIARLGYRFAENETSLMITELDKAANSVSGGATFTIANLTRMIQYLEDADATPSDFICGMEVANDIRNIDTFFEAQKSGGNNALDNNFIGTVYALRVWRVSTNAGMTATSSYVIDRNHALACVEKRPITAETWEMPTHDTQGIVVTQRVAFLNMRTTAVAKCTTS